jgi:hypothetical protein
MAFVSKYAKYQTTCDCGATTTIAFARKNAGRCKACVTGVAPVRNSRREQNLNEDTMGVSVEVLEHRHYNGDSSIDF